MKQKTMFFTLALFVGSIVSCSNDDNSSNNYEKVAVQLGGYIGTVETRASESVWTTNDSIGVFMTYTGRSLTSNTIREGVDNISYTTKGDGAFNPSLASKTIYFPIEGSVDFYAYYPYCKDVSGYKVPLNVSNQNNQEAIDFMYAKTVGQEKSQPKVSLNFAHKLCYLVLDVQKGEGITEADFKNLTITIKDKNTQAKYNLADGTIVDETSKANIVMKKLNDNKFVAILIPTAANSQIIEFNFNNKTDAPFSWIMQSTLESGKKYYYSSVKVSRTKVEVNGSITPWDVTEDNNTYYPD